MSNWSGFALETVCLPPAESSPAFKRRVPAWLLLPLGGQDGNAHRRSLAAQWRGKGGA